MRASSKRQLTGMALAVSLVAALVAEGARAEPLATAGIGVGNCAKLAGDMKPEDGFSNMANVLIYFWVQGYMSAANITTLEADSEYIDRPNRTRMASPGRSCRRRRAPRMIAAHDSMAVASIVTCSRPWTR